VVYVLRLGHRPQRDKRVTTHVALTARALGARGIAIWRPDAGIEESVRKATQSFGGDFEVRSLKEWRPFLKGWSGPRVHLTMYGLPLEEGMEALKQLVSEGGPGESGSQEPLVVVGAEKVPPFVFQTCEVNLSAGNQPHSEVAALALFLDRYFEGRAHHRNFADARLRITPSAKGKRVEDRKDVGTH